MRLRWLALAAGMVPLLVTGLVLLSSRNKPADAPVKSVSPEVWNRLALELEGVTPARLLLGAPGEDRHLSNALAREGIDREAFRKAASAVMQEFQTTPALGGGKGALPTVMDDEGLPEGVRLLGPSSAPAQVHLPAGQSEAAETMGRLLLASPADPRIRDQDR